MHIAHLSICNITSAGKSNMHNMVIIPVIMLSISGKNTIETDISFCEPQQMFFNRVFYEKEIMMRWLWVFVWKYFQLSCPRNFFFIFFGLSYIQNVCVQYITMVDRWSGFLGYNKMIFSFVFLTLPSDSVLWFTTMGINCIQ